MSWQVGGPGAGTGTQDPFSTVEAEVRAMVSAPWWNTAPPPQRAEAITSRMLAGAGEWWLFGAWARWYRCGLDGGWQPCPPPADPAARRHAFQAPRGAGNPPVPPQLLPTGPDLAAGRVASGGFLGPPPEPTVVARLEQAQINALSVNIAQFALADPAFQPHTPSTLAAAWGALLWCAGAPVALDAHPMIQLFASYLTTPAERLRWLTPPDFGTLVGYYAGRLGAGDWSGASVIVRVMHDVAAALRGDARFRPGADALAAITAASLPLVQHDMATARYGPAALIQEWRRRCPAEFALPMVRDAAPGEFLRLGLYDLQQTVARLHGHPMDHNEVRRAAVALLAADLSAAPAAAHAVLPWLDPDSARTVQAVLADPAHPGRALWPRDGRLPDALRGADAAALEELLATSYTLGLTWCRLAQSGPPPTGFAVAAAAATALTEAPAAPPPSTGELTPWQIIEAARAHMASERAAPAPAPEPVPPPEPPVPTGPATPPSAFPQDGPPVPPAEPAETGFPQAPPPASPGPPPAGGMPEPASPAAFAQDGPPPTVAGPVPPAPEAFPPPVSEGFPPAPPAAFPAAGPEPYPPAQAPGWPPPAPPGPPPLAGPQTAPYLPQTEGMPLAPPPPAPVREPEPAAEPVAAATVLRDAPMAEAYGIRFLSGADDVERLVTEVRRRGKWAQRLRGQEVSSASMPALLLIGEPSSGQRRLGRMVARALADVEVSSGQLRTVHADELRERGPDGLRTALADHSGHALLLEGLDGLILDDAQGPAYATVLYRARAEGVSDTALLATCEPGRLAALSAAAPEVITDLRAVRLPDPSDPAVARALLGLLAEERQLALDAEAWQVADRDLPALRGRGRLTGARLIETYLDRACTRHLGRAVQTQAIGSTGALVLTGADFHGLAAELSPPG